MSTSLLLLSSLLFSLVSSQSCPVLRQLLDDTSLVPVGPNNDICIIDRPNCCTKSTEERLLKKTKDIFDNRIFLVLNELLGKIDVDEKRKNTMMTKFLTTLELDLDAKKDLNNKFYYFAEGREELTEADLEKIQTGAAIGALQAAPLGDKISGTCEDLLFFELQPLKDAQQKYIYSVLLMLRGYTLLKGLINTVQRPTMTEQCYIGAVRGGMKFGGCNLCLKDSEGSQPCKMLCRNILSGCLKGHIQAREYLQLLTQNLVDLNTDVEGYLTEVNNEVSKLVGIINSKISTEQEFFASCGDLKSSGSIDTISYDFQLGYERLDALQSLDASWLCTYVFSGVSEVNCWNRSTVGEYRVNVYEFTEEGQAQNPEVPGSGPEIDLEDFISKYDSFKTSRNELSKGNTFTESSTAALLPSSPLTITIFSIFITVTLLDTLTFVPF